MDKLHDLGAETHTLDHVDLMVLLPKVKIKSVLLLHASTGLQREKSLIKDKNSTAKGFIVVF